LPVTGKAAPEHSSGLMAAGHEPMALNSSSRQQAASELGREPGLHADQCLATRYWWYFVLSSLISFACAFGLVLLGRLFRWLRRRSSQQGIVKPKSSREQDYFSAIPESADNSVSSSTDDVNVGWITAAKDWAGELISGQTTCGRILVRKARRCVPAPLPERSLARPCASLPAPLVGLALFDTSRRISRIRVELLFPRYFADGRGSALLSYR